MKQRPADAVVLFLDETKLRLFPPLRSAWALEGEQAEVQISGRNASRILFGTLNPKTGHRVAMARKRMRQEDYQAFMRLLRERYRSLPIWLLLDRASCHEAKKSQALAAKLGIEHLWLPKQCPELNLVDHLWRPLKTKVCANRQYKTADEQIKAAEEWYLGLTDREALRKAGALSKHFWLRDVL